jgi:hypothetical protein
MAATPAPTSAEPRELERRRKASRSGDLGEAAYARASHDYGINWVE